MFSPPQKAQFSVNAARDTWYCDVPATGTCYEVRARGGELAIYYGPGQPAPKLRPTPHARLEFTSRQQDYHPELLARLRGSEPTTGLHFAQAYDRLLTGWHNQLVRWAPEEPQHVGPTGPQYRVAEVNQQVLGLPDTGLAFIPSSSASERVALAEQLAALPAWPVPIVTTLASVSTDRERDWLAEQTWLALLDKCLHHIEDKYREVSLVVMDKETFLLFKHYAHRQASWQNAEPQPSSEPGRINRVATQYGTAEVLVDTAAQGTRLDVFS